MLQRYDNCIKKVDFKKEDSVQGSRGSVFNDSLISESIKNNTENE